MKDSFCRCWGLISWVVFSHPVFSQLTGLSKKRRRRWAVSEGRVRIKSDCLLVFACTWGNILQGCSSPCSHSSPYNPRVLSGHFNESQQISRDNYPNTENTQLNLNCFLFTCSIGCNIWFKSLLPVSVQITSYPDRPCVWIIALFWKYNQESFGLCDK